MGSVVPRARLDKDVTPRGFAAVTGDTRTTSDNDARPTKRCGDRRVGVAGAVAGLRPASSAVKVLTSDQEGARGVVAALVGPQAVASDEGYLVVEGSDAVSYTHLTLP